MSTIHISNEDVPEKPKPCPFCGSSNVELSNTHTPYYWVQCNECGAECPDWGERPSGEKTSEMDLHRASARRAVKAWNRRDG